MSVLSTLPLQRQQSNQNGHTNENDDPLAYDYEQGGGGESSSAYSTLSSAEASFDRLIQGLAYRDRPAFIHYVKQELERENENSMNQHRSPMINGNTSSAASANSSSVTDVTTKLIQVTSFYSQLPIWWRVVFDRFYLLATLLFLQSCSSLILSHFADFIQRHVIVTLYLTMLVGAGGNAGNQAAVLVIRHLATTSSRRIQPLLILWKEIQVAFVMGLLMILVGFGRVYLFEGGNVKASIAITASLYVIVTVSIILGSGLPLLLHHFRFDAAHAGPIIQVIMDVLGVAVTCAICSMILADSEPISIPDQFIDSTGHMIAG